MGQYLNEMSRGTISAGRISGDLRSNLRDSTHQRYTYETFDQRPLQIDDGGFGTPTGTKSDVNILKQEKNGFEWYVIATQTTVVFPWTAAAGLDLELDDTASDGLEITQGIGAQSRMRFTSKTDAMFFKVELKLTDASEISELAVGFRKAAAYDQALDDYTDMAAFNVQAGVINLETILNDASTDTTNTTETWTDGQQKTLQVAVHADGTVHYEIDGSAPSTVAAFTFDTGDVLIPFLHLMAGSTSHDSVTITLWEAGLENAAL